MFSDYIGIKLEIGNAKVSWNSPNIWKLNSVISVDQSCPTLCDPMDCCTPDIPVHHQLPEFAQTHVHWIGDAIQPFHPLSSPSPPTFNLSQHQGLFKWVSFSHQMAKVLQFQHQRQSFQWTLRTNLPLGWTDRISLQPKGLSRPKSNPIWLYSGSDK